MTCAEFDRLTDDDNGRDITTYANAELMAMVNHMRQCRRCYMKCFMDAAAFELQHSPEAIAQNTANAQQLYDRLCGAFPTDAELHTRKEQP